jgi:hypothetical protein
LNLNEEKQHAENELNKIKTEYDQLIKEYDEQKQKLEIQLGEVTQNLLQVIKIIILYLNKKPRFRYLNHYLKQLKPQIFNEKNPKNRL